MVQTVGAYGVLSTKETQVREIPKNDHDAILQLWHGLIGTNGAGLATRFEKMEEIFPELVTKKRCNAVQQEKKKNAGSVFGYIKDIFLIILSTTALLHGMGVL